MSDDALKDFVHLDYIHQSAYFLGEEFNATLDWFHMNYYFAFNGEYYITLSVNGTMTVNKTVGRNWSQEPLLIYPNSEVIPLFEEPGNMIITAFVPVWNSWNWMPNSATFPVTGWLSKYTRQKFCLCCLFLLHKQCFI